jgi:hypothetical protein
MRHIHTGDTTQKNGLLELAQTDLDAARAAFDAAADTYQRSHSIADRAVMVAAFNKLQEVQKGYQQAHRLLVQHEIQKVTG